MGKQVFEYSLQSRAARSRLKPREKPYWRLLEDGRHLGYFKGVTTCRWVARMLVSSETAAYLTYRIGQCDDVEDPDGERVLNWAQAKARAEMWFELQKVAPIDQPVQIPSAAKPKRGSKVPTVGQSIDAYVALRDARYSARVGRVLKSDAHRLKRHVLQRTRLGDVALDELTEAQLQMWREGLTGLKPTARERLASDLKAALNGAFSRNKAVLPMGFPIIVKDGLKANDDAWTDEPLHRARDNQILTDDRVAEIIAIATELDPDLDYARMIVALAATGARFSQLMRMLVQDVQIELSRLMIPPSRKGRGRKSFAPIRVQVGADVLALLRPIVEGRAPDTPLFERWRWVQKTPMLWERDRRGAWTSASELTRFWKSVMERSGLTGIVPYALRHSSIVRGIRVGLPIRLVAALHDTSIAMIERHYARWIVDGLDELAAKAIVPLVKDGCLPDREHALV
jgi:integrase